ncbi:MAG: isoprenyl transferase [Bauldia sp.]|nr:isoprenyl transferase [Bauldia sp.]
MPRPGATQNASSGDDPSPGIPRHVGIIMDGNGRWATARGLPRMEGHRRGMDAVRGVIRAASDFGVSHLTLYSFSSENWSRPTEEVEFLFGLLRIFIQSELADLHANRVRIRVIGSEQGVPEDILETLAEAEKLTAANSGLGLQVAFNYGGRDEIARAVRRLAADVAEGTMSAETIGAEAIAARLDTAGIPDPDLIIRTGGEVRLSNFLLWQAAYAELLFVPTYWPEFDKEALAAAIDEFARRTRRYGGLATARA